jgi:hypothetical protein
MSENNCPVCYSDLLTKEVTPCMDCGASETGLKHYIDSTYVEYEVYYSQRLILCNFCYVDFGSYKPSYFGFPDNKKIGLQDFNFIKEITVKSLRVDKYCPECDKRLAFLKFVAVCRESS